MEMEISYMQMLHAACSKRWQSKANPATMGEEAAATHQALLGVAFTGATSWIKLKLLRTGGGNLIDEIQRIGMDSVLTQGGIGGFAGNTAHWMPTGITRETWVHNIFNLIYIDMSAADAQTHHSDARTSAEVEAEECGGDWIGAKE